MSRWAAIAAIWLAVWLVGARAQFFNPPMFFPGSAFTPSCSQSTTYLAAVSGLSTDQKTAYDTAICGMVSDTDFARLDALYFFANASDANALVNVANPGTYNLVEHGTCTFTANVGITGDAGGCYEDTGFVPSTATSPQFVQDSGTIAACILNSRTTDQAWTDMGNYANPSAIQGRVPTASFGFGLNAAGTTSVANTNAQGAWFVTRTASNLTTVYLNGSSFTTDATASSGLSTSSMYILGLNFVGSLLQPSGDQIGYAFIGSGLSSAQALRIYNRLHTMMSSAPFSLGAC